MAQSVSIHLRYAMQCTTHSPGQALTLPLAIGRRSSTVLNPRSYVKEKLWTQAPVFTGSTNFEPLADAKNILITGGAGFMYVASKPLEARPVRLFEPVASARLMWTQSLLVRTPYSPYVPPL